MAQQVASLYADIGAKVDNFQKGAATVFSGLGKMALSFGAVTAAVQVMEQAWDFAKEGAALERLTESGAEMARQYGGNMDLIVQKVKEASHNTVSEMDIIASSNKAIMLGLGADADQLANLMEIAAFRGRAMGLSTTQAFDDIVRGVGRASPMILDNLGIVVSAKETYDNYAKEIGKSANELTKAEKTQALLNAVLKSGNKLLDEAGGLVEDNASQYEQLNARVEDYTNSVKMSVNEAVTPSVEAFLDLSDAMDEASEATGLTDQRSRIYLGAIQQQVNAMEEEEKRLRSVSTARLDGLASLYGYANATQEVTQSLEDEEAAQEAMNDANNEFLSLLGQVQSTQEDYHNEQQDLIDENMELEAEKQELLAQGWWLESEKIQDINAKIDENNAKYAENSAAFELENKKIMLGYIERKLTADGVLDDKELIWLTEKGVAWGIYHETAVAEVQAMIDEANGLIEGLQDAATFTMTLQTIYETYGDASTYGAGGVGGPRAAGGPVSGGMMYPVTEKGMPELLNYGGQQMLMMPPGGSGFVTPLSGGNGGGGAGSTVIVNVMLDSATPDPERVAYNLAPAVERVLRSRKLL